MQLLESLISLLVLLSLSIFLFIPADEKVDNSLYLQELQGDAKNVIHLRGGFENLTNGNAVAEEILEKTGMCVEMGQTELTSSLVAEGAPSSFSYVPNLKRAPIAGTEISNLTGFTSDSFFFGPCAR
jgi:hypothetical protein